MIPNRGKAIALYGGLTGLAVVWLVPVATVTMISVLPLDQSRAGWWNADLGELTYRNFVNAWPAKWDGPDFNAEGNDIAIETLELAHEGVTRA